MHKDKLAAICLYRQ